MMVKLAPWLVVLRVPVVIGTTAVPVYRWSQSSF